MQSEMVKRAKVPNASVVFHSAPLTAMSRQPKGWPNFLEIRCSGRHQRSKKQCAIGSELQLSQVSERGFLPEGT